MTKPASHDFAAAQHRIEMLTTKAAFAIHDIFDGFLKTSEGQEYYDSSGAFEFETNDPKMLRPKDLVGLEYEVKPRIDLPDESLNILILAEGAIQVSYYLRNGPEDENLKKELSFNSAEKPADIAARIMACLARHQVTNIGHPEVDNPFLYGLNKYYENITSMQLELTEEI